MSLYTSFQKVLNSLGMKTIEYPLFYNSEFAIRFNIGDDNGSEVYLDNNDDEFAVNPIYVEACLDRTKQIYSRLKSEPDLLLIEGYIAENSSVEDFIKSVMSSTDLPQPDEIKTELVISDDDNLTHIYLFWNLNSFNPDKILKEIILADVETGNDFLTSSVYFVCTDNNTIFHLYDDRGADIVSEKKETLDFIYDKDFLNIFGGEQKNL